MKKLGPMLLVAVLALNLASPVFAGSGKKIYNNCRSCHSLKEGKNKMGPSLYNLFDREAGTVSRYRYSKALKNSGIVWTKETLDTWLQGMAVMVPGTKMRIRGLKEKDRQVLIEYLWSLQRDR